jgi:dihydrofolate reductase
MVRKRKIIVLVLMASTTDGYIARPDGSVDWLDRPNPKGHYGMDAFYRSIDTILWGRKTYEVALEFQRKGVPGSAFDRKIKNYVFTHTLPQSDAPPGIKFVNEPVRAFATSLRETPGKDVWMMGGAGIAASFLDEGEIDELIIHMIPVLIGEGIPLIAALHRTVPLKLISCKKFPDGVVSLRYAVRRA